MQNMSKKEMRERFKKNNTRFGKKMQNLTKKVKPSNGRKRGKKRGNQQKKQ